MFDTGAPALDDAQYERLEPKLRADLLDAQAALKERGDFPVVVLINGVDGAGKGETVNLFNEWMDPRYLRTVAFGPLSEEEARRPPAWRFWQALPPKGRIGLLFGSWYSDPLVDRVEGHLKKRAFREAIDAINRFEQLLIADGALVVKLWFHLSKRHMKKRLLAIDKDQQRTWRVRAANWRQYDSYQRYAKQAEVLVQKTSTPAAPWVVIEGHDDNYRSVTAGQTLLSALNRRLKSKPSEKVAPRRKAQSGPPAPLADLDLSQKLDDAEYDDLLVTWQERFARLVSKKRFQDTALVVAFEGMDAAGKGSTIRRLTGALDARQYRVVPIAAPSDEERAHPYLWRFWREWPKKGQVTIFDRSWYGRVLVERVEGFATEPQWLRAFDEINDFEAQATRAGTILVKCWMQISPDVQLERFKAREETRFKRFKITPDDWRNRKKWGDYQTAANEMIVRTSGDKTPWTLVAANDKRFARIGALQAVVRALES
jgi:AMP-polyphosphate phosphotransferase